MLKIDLLGPNDATPPGGAMWCPPSWDSTHQAICDNPEGWAALKSASLTEGRDFICSLDAKGEVCIPQNDTAAHAFGVLQAALNDVISARPAWMAQVLPDPEVQALQKTKLLTLDQKIGPETLAAVQHVVTAAQFPAAAQPQRPSDVATSALRFWQMAACMHRELFNLVIVDGAQPPGYVRCAQLANLQWQPTEARFKLAEELDGDWTVPGVVDGKNVAFKVTPVSSTKPVYQRPGLYVAVAGFLAAGAAVWAAARSR